MGNSISDYNLQLYKLKQTILILAFLCLFFVSAMFLFKEWNSLIPLLTPQFIVILVLVIAKSLQFTFIVIKRGFRIQELDFTGKAGWFFFSALIMSSTLVITMFFAIIYFIFGLKDGSGDKPELIHDIPTSFYFSIVTFTTLGYGDVQPSQSVRFIAAFEAFLGYLYLGVLVALVIKVLSTPPKSPEPKRITHTYRGIRRK